MYLTFATVLYMFLHLSWGDKGNLMYNLASCRQGQHHFVMLKKIEGLYRQLEVMTNLDWPKKNKGKVRGILKFFKYKSI